MSGQEPTPRVLRQQSRVVRNAIANSARPTAERKDLSRVVLGHSLNFCNSPLTDQLRAQFGEKGELVGSKNLGGLPEAAFDRRPAASRSCEKTAVEFREDLTVLVGENNVGQSNLVDALRLLTITLNGRRERYRGRRLASGCRNSERSVRRSVCRIERHAEGTADKNQRTTSWPTAEPTKHHQAAKHKDKHPIRPTPRRYTRSRISALVAGSS